MLQKCPLGIQEPNVSSMASMPFNSNGPCKIQRQCTVASFIQVIRSDNKRLYSTRQATIRLGNRIRLAVERVLVRYILFTLYICKIVFVFYNNWSIFNTFITIKLTHALRIHANTRPRVKWMPRERVIAFVRMNIPLW